MVYRLPRPSASFATVAAVALGLALAACGADDGGTPSWEAITFDSEPGWLLAVHGAGGGALRMVGGAPSAGEIHRLDGASATAEAVPSSVTLLNWIWSFEGGPTYAVGNGGTVLIDEGAGWAPESTPTSEDLWGVWGASPDDVWAVGGCGFEGCEATVIRRRNGQWSEVLVPPLNAPDVRAFFKVWGSAGDDVYIVGQRGAVVRFDGGGLSEIDVGATDDLISVWGTGPDRVAIVGGRSNGVVVTWDGAAWRHVSLAPAPGLNGVFMRHPSTIHVAGNLGLLGTVDFDSGALAEHDASVGTDFHAVFAGSDGRAVAVGGNFQAIGATPTGAAVLRDLGSGE